MKTLEESVEYCANIAYNSYMGGSNGIWYNVPLSAMSFVYGISEDEFFYRCEMKFDSKFPK